MPAHSHFCYLGLDMLRHVLIHSDDRHLVSTGGSTTHRRQCIASNGGQAISLASLSLLKGLQDKRCRVGRRKATERASRGVVFGVGGSQYSMLVVIVAT